MTNNLSDSILNTIKKKLGVSEEDTNFDVDIISNINSVLNILSQIGLTTADNFCIVDDTETWSDILSTSNNLNLVIDYIYFKVKKMFDPPQSSIAMEALNSTISELEWRINAIVDYRSFEND